MFKARRKELIKKAVDENAHTEKPIFELAIDITKKAWGTEKIPSRVYKTCAQYLSNAISKKKKKDKRRALK